jgi:hypothetical protein
VQPDGRIAERAVRCGIRSSRPSAGFGKVWNLSTGFSIDTSASGEWTVYRRFTDQTEQFTLNFQITLLFPKTRL